MNLYKLSQTANVDYDTYDSCIVAAESEQEAKKIHPSENCPDSYDENYGEEASDMSWFYLRSWTRQRNVKVELVGVAIEGTKKGVILASFNAG